MTNFMTDLRRERIWANQEEMRLRAQRICFQCRDDEPLDRDEVHMVALACLHLVETLQRHEYPEKFTKAGNRRKNLQKDA